MDLTGGLSWRYRQYVKPYLMLHENLSGAVNRICGNFRLKRQSEPFCYIFADASNIGDRISAQGVSFLTGRPGVEIFAARAGLASTFRTIKWLEKYRPKTRIIIGGGGLLQECFNPFWTDLLQTKLPFVLFGVGVNEMPGKRNVPPADIMKTLAHRARAIHVRDRWSRDLLQYGQEAPVTVGVCPSVNYLVSIYGARREQPGRYLLHVQHPVDVNLAGGDPHEHRLLIKALARELDLVYDETDHIKENLSSLAEKYLRARYVVSSRLHGCIFSFAFGVPFVPIVLDKKTAAFVETHIPDNPVAGVYFHKTEVAEKLFDADNARTDVTRTLGTVLENNVAIMQNMLTIF